MCSSSLQSSASETLSISFSFVLLQLYEFVSLLSDAKDLLVKTVDDLLGPSFGRTDLDDPDLLNDLNPRTLVDILDLGTRFDVPDALPKGSTSSPNQARIC